MAKKKTTTETIPQEDIVEIKPEELVPYAQAENNTALNENVLEPYEAPHVEDTVATNWNFYNQLHTISPYSSHGGKHLTPSDSKRSAKRKKRNKTQRNSRRINRNK